MFLLFLLVFNSATALSSDSFEEREVTTERVKVLSVAAWPSIFLSSDPEAINRSWKFLTPLREHKRLIAATELLDSFWPATDAEAEDLWNDYAKWKVIWRLVQERSSRGTMVEWFDPDSNYWTYGTVGELIGLLNSAKYTFGDGGGWLFPDYNKFR